MQSKPKKTVVITGANRGIGLALVTKYIEHGFHVIGTYRTDKKVIEDLGATAVNVDFEHMDEMNSFACWLEDHVPHIDIFIHNAALSHYHWDLSKEQKNVFLGTLEQSGLERMIRINALIPMLLSQRLIPLFEQASHPKIIFISSRKGSMSLVHEMGGGNYGYRGSKALLNMWATLFAQDVALKGICVNTIHPGWVRTQMGGMDAPLSAMESAQQLFQLIDGLSMKHSGMFLKLDGTIHPY